jgi:glutaredoxin
LRKHHIPFQEIDVSIDDAAAEEMVRKSGQRGVPQIEIDSQIIVGSIKNVSIKCLELLNKP